MTHPARSRPPLRPAALTLAVLLAAAACAPVPQPSPSPAAPVSTGEIRWGLAIHGGAGTLSPDRMSAEREAQYRAALEQSLRAGHAVLSGGGSSLDAVIAAVQVMEESPLFNAGKGAVFTNEGTNELDAAVMFGPTLNAGAVAGLKHVRSPIALARAVMERSPHVMMVGEGAESFAREQGIEIVPASYFYTESRWEALQRALAEEQGAPATRGGGAGIDIDDRKFGTVGAVALDRQGRLSAATSTGGMTNKRWGRVGDVPIIGAGTYASPACAVSATGHGEYFIRNTVAHDICARMAYGGASLQDAATTVVHEVLVEAGGDGGVIAMDARGNWVLTFNTTGMYRGYVGADGRSEVAIFRD